MYADPFYSASARKHIKLERSGRPWTAMSTDPWRPPAVEALQMHELKDEAETLMRCGYASGWVRACPRDPGHYHQPLKNWCRRRYCPQCQFDRNRDFVRAYINPVMRAITNGPKSYTVQHLTFTTRYALTDPDIRQHMASCRQAVAASLKKVLKGVLRDQRNEKERGRRELNLKAHGIGLMIGTDWGVEGERLHFHVLYFGPRIPYTELRDVWKEKTGGTGEHVLVKVGRRRRGDVARLMRYVVKVTLPQADHLPYLVDAVRDQRVASLQGIWHGIKEPIERRKKCRCGAFLERAPEHRH